MNRHLFKNVKLEEETTCLGEIGTEVEIDPCAREVDGGEGNCSDSEGEHEGEEAE